MHHKMLSSGLMNFRTAVISPTAPKIPDNASVLFICDVLHHVSNRREWLQHVTRGLDADDRIVPIEFAEGALPEGPPEALKIPKGELIQLASSAGLKLTRDLSNLLPYQVFLEFQPSP